MSKKNATTTGDSLPSRLTPMERLHLLRHKEEYPNSIFARLSFVGTIDRSLFQQAFDFMVARHEMAVAQLCENAKWWQRPLDGSTEQSVLIWHDRDFDHQPYEARPVSLKVGEGFRCEVFIGENRVDLVTQIHHAKVDGLGALQGIRDLLSAYNNLVAKHPIDHGFRRLNPECFRNRHRIGLYQQGWWKRLPVQWIPVYGAIKFGMARVSHLLGETTPSNNQQPLLQFPSTLRKKLDLATYAKLRAGNASVNEKLLAALFLAIARFQEESGLKRGSDKLRIVVPISIRDRADLRGSACNRMAFVQLDRTDHDLRDPAGLIWGINYELGIINRFNFEKAVLVTMKLMSLIPGFLDWRLSRRKCKATTLLTNLGTPFRNMKVSWEDGYMVCGNMKCVDVELIPPFYDLIPAVFLFSIYAGTPSLLVHFDPRVISRERASRLHRIFLEEIEKIALGV